MAQIIVIKDTTNGTMLKIHVPSDPLSLATVSGSQQATSRMLELVRKKATLGSYSPEVDAVEASLSAKDLSVLEVTGRHAVSGTPWASWVTVEVTKGAGSVRAVEPDPDTQNPPSSESKNKPSGKSLDKWFRERWVDLSRPKPDGGYEECGRPDADEGKYPKCVPSARAAKMSDEEIASAIQRKRRAESRRQPGDKTPINVPTIKAATVNVPADPELYARVKAEAKAKFRVYPSIYANAWLVREYKKQGGTYKVAKAGAMSKSDNAEMGDEVELKAVPSAADIDVITDAVGLDPVPQERITGDVLRGYGPRRGNLEQLLRYWRPIMRREGGFRRCLVILADHPELYPLENLCAWLHHETTGLWPNEGCHHPGMKNCRNRAARLIQGERPNRGSILSDSEFEDRLKKIRGRKSAEGFSQTTPQSFGEYRLIRFLTASGKRLALPDVQSEQGIQVKVGLVGSHSKPVQALQGAASAVIPGDLSNIRSPIRSAAWSAITPGAPNRQDRNLIRRALRAAPKEQLRCPPGFEHGGQFTDKQLTTCGARLFDLPGFGLVSIGKFSARLLGAEDPLSGQAIAASAPDGPTTRLRAANVGTPNEGDGPNPPAPLAPSVQAAQGAMDISRIALINPVGALDKNRIEESITKAIPIAAKLNNPSFARLVRQDGTMLDNVVPVIQLADIRGSEDMENGYLVTAITDPGKFAVDEFQTLSGGLAGIVMATPDGKGFIRLERASTRNNKIRGLRRRWGTLLRDTPDNEPGIAFSTLIDEAGADLKLSVQYPGIKNPNEMIQIERKGQIRNVRRWVYQMFLSPKAPMRPTGTEAWDLTEAEAKPEAEKTPKGE